MTTKTTHATCIHYWRCLDGKANTKAVCLKCGARTTFTCRELPFNKQADLSLAARHYRSDNHAEIQIAREAAR